MLGFLRYRRRRVKAAFFLTNAFEVLQNVRKPVSQHENGDSR